MVTNSSKRDDMVLDSIQRLGFAMRDLLRHALGGLDPNNILNRLLARQAIQSVKGALAKNRVYYLPKAQAALATQTLHLRMAVSWHVLTAEANVERVCLTNSDTKLLLGHQTPAGVHLLEKAKSGARIVNVYAPLAQDVVSGAQRHLDKARSFPKVSTAIEQGDYSFAVLVPWIFGPVRDLERALQGEQVTGMRRIAEPCGARFTVARVATPDTLDSALSSL